MKEILKCLSESQWYIIGVKSFNMYAFSLEMHFFNVLNSEEEMKQELMSVNTVCQQFSKIVLWWRATQNSASQIQKEWQQKNAKLFSIKAVQEGIYYKTQKLQKSVILQKISLNINVNKNNYQSKIKKFNSKTAITTFVLESVKASAFAYILKQAAVAN